jgi:hypothetical protein
MPQTQVSCPRCRQPIPATIEQLFDVTADPESKKRLLGRVSNYARCPYCKFDGPLSTPIVYHDNDKELLLTYFPAELGMSVNDQEKMIGPMISQAMNRLPQEKRKAYLLRPQSFFTFQTMIEKILEKDGISKEVLDENQKQLALIQRLIQTSTSSVRVDMIKQEASIINERFFALFERFAQSAIASGQEQAAQSLGTLQQELLDNTEYGKQVAEQIGEMDAAAKTLQDLGGQLTREKLIDLLIEAPSEARVNSLVSLTRNGLDQSFFQIFTQRIEAATDEQKPKLLALQAKIVEIARSIDKAFEAQAKQAEQFIEALIAEPDIPKAAAENIEAFQNEVVIQVLEQLLRDAHEKKEEDRLAKLQLVLTILQQASTPPEVEFINAMVDIANDPIALEQFLDANEQHLTNEVNAMVVQLIQQVEQSGKTDEQTLEIQKRLQLVYGTIIGRSMKKNAA